MSLTYIRKIPHRYIKAIPFWIAAACVGIIAIGYAEIFKIAEEFASHFLITHPLYMLILTPTAFLLAWALIKIAPDAKGSGLPQVMVAALASEKKRPDLLERILGLKTAAVKIISSIIGVIGGGAVGREGPTAQIAASIFYFIGKQCEKLGLKKVSPDIWIVTGSAAGIAAAFNTPLGGIVFAIEELYQGSFHRLKMVLISSVITAGLIAQAIAGSYLYLGYPALSDIPIASHLWVIGFGLLSGAAGAIFAKVLYTLLGQTKKIPRKIFPFFVILMGISVALIGIQVGPHAIGAGREVLIDLLFKNATIDWQVALSRLCTPILTYISGVSGGVFAPSLSAGGCLGYIYATFFKLPYIHLFIMLGMVGFLTGVTRAPFTSFVLVLEMTDQHLVIFPMMIVAFMASIAARFIDPKSFYARVKRDYWIQKKEETAPLSSPLSHPN